MKSLYRLFLAAASAAFFIVSPAQAQNSGTLTQHAFAIGKGAGVGGYTSLLCGSAQLAVGQSAADPICVTLSGDVTMTAGGITALGNIPSATPMAGSLLGTDIAAPATPAAGKDSVWVDSTDKRLHDKNDAGTIGTTVVSDSGAANNFLTGIGTNGAISKSRPGCANLSDASPFCNGTNAANLTGTVPSAQLPLCSASQFGACKPDGTTITVVGGVITASGSSATAITAGTTSVVTSSNSNDFLTTGTVSAGTGTLADAGYGPQQLAWLNGCTNCGLKFAASANNITVTLTDQAGNNLSATDVAVACFRNDSTTNAEVSCINITSNLSVTLNAGSNLGVTGTTQPFRVWVSLFNNAGTVQIAVGVATNYSTLSIINWSESNPTTATLCNACISATASQIWYSNPNIGSNAPFRIIGYAEFAAFVTNGNWVAPTAIHLCGWGCTKPAEVISKQMITNGGQTRACSTTAANVAGTTITASAHSPANLFLVHYSGHGAASAGGAGINTELEVTIGVGGVASGSANNIIGVVSGSGTNLQTDGTIDMDQAFAPQTISAQTYTLMTAGLNASGNCNTTSIFGSVEEIQG